MKKQKTHGHLPVRYRSSSKSKAQVANTLVATLGQLVKLQDDLRLQQTLNLMESTLIDVIKSQPDPFKEEFLKSMS